MSDQSWTIGYNGFRFEAGYSVIPIQNDALRRGIIARPTMCGICRDGRSERPKGRDYRYLHLEDYAKPLVIHPCCKSCHAALHARFRDLERWQRLLARHGGRVIGQRCCRLIPHPNFARLPKPTRMDCRRRRRRLKQGNAACLICVVWKDDR